jgi:molecular chaperone IbpA
MASLLNNSLQADPAPGYPPYDIEMLEENKYAITVAVAGFSREELSLEVEKNVLTVRGEKRDKVEKHYLHRGIANRKFERKFNLADHVEVTGAELANGLLTVQLVKEIPERMKPKTIDISDGSESATGRIENNKQTDDEAA